MAIVNVASLNCNKNFKIDFNGGNLSSDAGLLLMKEFMHKFGIPKIIDKHFHTTDPGHIRQHKDKDVLLQALYQIFSAYFTDDCADELKKDPVFTSVLEKDTLASQPTLSRFYNRLDESTLTQLAEIGTELRKKVYHLRKRDEVLLDIDSTLFEAYGKQEGKAFNYHYQAEGYHPLLCYEALTGDLIKAELRNGSDYCCNGAADFLEPIFKEYEELFPEASVFLRGDSGFASGEIYSVAEKHDVLYAIRLKENSVLTKLATEIESELYKKTEENTTDYAVVYGEFEYKAKSWDKARRVVCKIEKPKGSIIHLFTFVVTNMKSAADKIIAFYCKRGKMENFIKEGKNGFDFGAVSSSTKVVNANRLQIHVLAYNIFNWFRRLVLPDEMKKDRVDTVRMKLFKIAVKIVRKARYVYFRLCSSCPYKEEYISVLSNIANLKLQPE